MLQNPNILIDYTNLKTNDDFYWISKNTNIDLDYVAKNMDKHWCLNSLCKNTYNYELNKVKNLDDDFDRKTKLPTDTLRLIGSFL